MLSESKAWELAGQHFGDDLADWVRLERTDFGWIARVEEPPIGPGDVIGQPVLVMGPEADQARFYPPMPPVRLRHAHKSWLETASRFTDVDGPASFM